MKLKRILVAAIAALMLIGCVACNNNSSNSGDSPKKDRTTVSPDSTKKPEDTKKADVNLTPAEIEKKIADAIGADNYLCTVDRDIDFFYNYYGFDRDKVDAVVAKESTITSVNLDKVMKVKDGYADAAVEALNKSYAQTVGYIRQYAFGVQKVLNARIVNEGNYVIFALAGASYDGEDSEAELKLAEAEYAKIDAVLSEIFGGEIKNLAVVPADDGNHGGLMPGGLIGG